MSLQEQLAKSISDRGELNKFSNLEKPKNNGIAMSFQDQLAQRVQNRISGSNHVFVEPNKSVSQGSGISWQEELKAKKASSRGTGRNTNSSDIKVGNKD